MNPEQKPVLYQTIAQLEATRSMISSLQRQVDANHPDADRVGDALQHLSAAIASLQGIHFGLESDFSYDD
ncbi:hypothetical protein [Spirosoma aerolatum]|uniref:hypothetical protein n=1 Tax=Spirosoma aerolatum TaxID=1211326 RepID=UPI0009ADC9C3|nr:hypothetical protein [Spirosoma aerolatum]